MRLFLRSIDTCAVPLHNPSHQTLQAEYECIFVSSVQILCHTLSLDPARSKQTLPQAWEYMAALISHRDTRIPKQPLRQDGEEASSPDVEPRKKSTHAAKARSPWHAKDPSENSSPINLSFLDFRLVFYKFPSCFLGA